MERLESGQRQLPHRVVQTRGPYRQIRVKAGRSLVGDEARHPVAGPCGRFRRFDDGDDITRSARHEDIDLAPQSKRARTSRREIIESDALGLHPIKPTAPPPPLGTSLAGSSLHTPTSFQGGAATIEEVVEGERLRRLSATC